MTKRKGEMVSLSKTSTTLEETIAIAIHNNYKGGGGHTYHSSFNKTLRVIKREIALKAPKRKCHKLFHKFISIQLWEMSLILCILTNPY